MALVKTAEAQPVDRSGRSLTGLAAWALVLVVSLLPDILFQELSGYRPGWLFAAKMSVVLGLLAAGWVWRALRPLRLFGWVVLSLYLVEWGVARLDGLLQIESWLQGLPPFVQQLGAVQIPRAAAYLAFVLVLWVLFGRRERFFLAKGQLDAPAQPIPLVLDRPPSWKVLGPAIAGAMCLGLLVFIFAFGRPPSLSSLVNVLPLLPFVLLFAANNAFGEEMLYRAPWLGALEAPLGGAQALLLTAVYFGLGHYYGVPYGVVGCVMAFIPGWLMGKAMLETRGFLWAWLIHFAMDFVIFFFMAFGSIAPGG